MKKRVWMGSLSDPNLKSKIQNLKWAGFLALLVGWAGIAEAQQRKSALRIGYLSPVDAARESTAADAIRLALRDLGYVEGQNIVFEYRFAEGKLERLFALAADLVGLKVDIILVAGGNRPIQAAKNATSTIPIVMMGAGRDPVKAGFVESLARPGGNVTGLATLRTDLGGKRLELLKDAVPKITRVAALFGHPTNEVSIKNSLQDAARALTLVVQPWQVRGADDFDRVFVALEKERPDALWVHEGRLMQDNHKRIAGAALKNRLPTVFAHSEAVGDGGLLYYGADLTVNYSRIAYYLDRIVKGAKPADLPVEQPTKFELVINLKAAKQIGLTIPPNVLARADRVIR